jgi:hypothetical protein
MTRAHYFRPAVVRFADVTPVVATSLSGVVPSAADRGNAVGNCQRITRGGFLLNTRVHDVLSVSLGCAGSREHSCKIVGRNSTELNGAKLDETDK